MTVADYVAIVKDERAKLDGRLRAAMNLALMASVEKSPAAIEALRSLAEDDGLLFVVGPAILWATSQDRRMTAALN